MYRTIAVAAALLTACSSSQDKGTTSAGVESGGSTGGTSGGAGTGASTGTTGGSQSSSSSTGAALACSDVGPSLGNFMTMYSLDLCDFVFGCQADANYYFSLCASYAAPGYGDLAAGVDAGRIQYCAGSGQTCLSGFQYPTCFGPPPNELIACQETLRGLVVLGQPCDSNADCSGGFCKSANGCAGTCTAWAETGDACSDALPCNPTEGLGCLSGTCVAPRGINSLCGPTAPPCDATQGLTCIAGACQSPPQQLTKPCEFGLGQCQSGSYCFQKDGTSSGRCTAQVPGGGICAEDADHLRNAFSATDFECQDGFQVIQCVGAGTLLDGGVNPGKCGSTEGEMNFCPDVPAGLDLTKPFGSGCFFGLDCLGPTMAATCDRPPGAGKPCWAPPFPCDPTKAFCNYAEGDGGGICQAAFRSGAACTGPGQCGAFNVCSDAGVCQLPTGPVCSPAF